MKKLSLISAVAMLFLISQPALAQQSEMAKKHDSAGVTCMQCHNQEIPTAALEINCTSCHGAPEAVAKLTAEKYKQYYNPHDPLHYGTYSECANCHRQHKESRLECNNSNCHKEFKYRVP